jgi:hypothetical protein
MTQYCKTLFCLCVTPSYLFRDKTRNRENNEFHLTHNANNLLCYIPNHFVLLIKLISVLCEIFSKFHVACSVVSITVTLHILIMVFS